MKRRLTDNMLFKIGALLFAILLWMYVVNEENPVTTVTIGSIPIVFENTEVFTDNNLTYAISGSSTATVKVTIRKNDRSRISASDFTATVDCNLINDLNGAAKVTITYTGSYEDSSFSWTAVTDTVQIESEAIETVSYKIQITTSGEVADGYMIYDIAAASETVTVTAPRSKQTEIASAGVTVDVTEANGEVTAEAYICFYDKWGEAILLQGDDITLSQESVTVTISVFKTNQALVDFSNVSGTDAVAEGYRYQGIEYSFSMVELAGQSDLVAELERIVIPATELDVTGASETIVRSIDLSQYLPEGVQIVSDSVVEVTLLITAVDVKELEYVSSRIQWIGKTADYEYELEDVGRLLSIVISGLTGELENVTASDFVLSVDVSGYEEGTYDILLTSNLAELSDTIMLTSPSSVRITIVRTEESEAESSQEETVEAEKPEEETGETENPEESLEEAETGEELPTEEPTETESSPQEEESLPTEEAA